MITETFAQETAQQIIPAYLYEQYNDDADLLAFVNAYNSLAQGYLDWFNATNLALYTSPNISGQLLDWTANGIYGIARPIISNLTTRSFGAMATYPMAKSPMAKHTTIQGGNYQVATDDIYKRVMTWILYKNDGMQMSIQWLRKRVARFLYGANGSDVSLNYMQNVNITQPSAHAINITIPSMPISNQFISLAQQSVLPLPFQVAFTFTIA